MIEFAASVTDVCSTPQGSRPAPVRPEECGPLHQSRWALDGSVASDELRPVTRPGRLPAAEIDERDSGVGAAPKVARQQSAGDGFQLGRDVWPRRGGRRTEDPLHVGCHGEMTRTPGEIADPEPRHLDRRVERHELQQVERNAVPVVLEPAVAAPVPGDMDARFVADRQGRRSPQRAGVLVAYVDRFTGPIPDGIIRPRREAVLATVAGPRGTAALGRHLEAEVGIADDIDPRRGRAFAVPQDRDVLVAVERESAKPVEELRRRHVRRRRRRPGENR